ncbi:unnamed protein product, partial [Ectocarpus sp. 6 AP-2014]
ILSPYPRQPDDSLLRSPRELASGLRGVFTPSSSTPCVGWGSSDINFGGGQGTVWAAQSRRQGGIELFLSVQHGVQQ